MARRRDGSTGSIPGGLSLAQPPEPTRAQNQPPLLRPGRVIRAASVLYAGVWAALILSPPGNDPRLVFALVWTSTLTYLGALLLTAGAMLELRREKRALSPPRAASTLGTPPRA